jgi:hypothetical protein
MSRKIAAPINPNQMRDVQNAINMNNVHNTLAAIVDVGFRAHGEAEF